MSRKDRLHEYRSSMDAVADGTEAGLRIYLQIIAMLIVTVALVALATWPSLDTCCRPCSAPR